MVKTLSNLMSHANATIQLNALWGLVVSGGRGWEGGREGAGGMGKGAGKKGRMRGGNIVGMTRYASNILDYMYQ